MKVADRASPGDVVAERYKLERLLGEGGVGSVYLARHELTGRPVAIKLVPTSDPVVRERLLREARSMGRLSHPNVIGVMDMGEWRGLVFIAMEYVYGENLREFAGVEKVGVREAIDLLLPACSGVAAAHQAGILHRDLKPENLFIHTDRDGTPVDTKVLDFGVAKALDAVDGNVSLTDSGSIVGTPKYMAPEQIAEEPILDARTDVYAMALILYEMLAGHLPYTTSNLRHVVLEILKGEFPSLHSVEPGVPEALSDVIMRGLCADAEGRYGTMAEFAKALEPWAERRSFMPPLAVQTTDTARDSWLPPSSGHVATPLDLTTRRSVRGERTPDPSDVDEVVADTVDRGATPNGTEVRDRDGGTRGALAWPWVLAAAALFLVAGWGLVGGSREQAPTSPSAVTGPRATDAPTEVPAAPVAVAPPAPLPRSTPDAGVAAPDTASPAATAAPPPAAPPAASSRRSTKATPPDKRAPRRAARPRATPRRPAPAPAPAPPKTDNRDPWAATP